MYHTYLRKSTTTISWKLFGAKCTTRPDAGHEVEIQCCPSPGSDKFKNIRLSGEMMLGGGDDIDRIKSQLSSLLAYTSETWVWSSKIWYWGHNIARESNVSWQVLMTWREISLRSCFMTILTLWIFKSKSSAETPRWINCEEPAYQSRIVSHRKCSELRVISSGKEVLRRGDIWVGLSLRKSGGG